MNGNRAQGLRPIGEIAAGMVAGLVFRRLARPNARGSAMAGVILLPRTEAGRRLLCALLPATRSPLRPDGELPDGSSIFGTDFDALAEQGEREFADFERWCREQGR